MWFASIEASRSERSRRLPGDGVVPEPIFTVTHAITIEAPPEAVWPWLVQMGSHRGGWYSWDRIDNGGRPSVDAVVDEYQHVKPGDVLPALPGATDAFVVAEVEPPRYLLLTVPSAERPITSWVHVIEPMGSSCSRLIARGWVAPAWKRMARGARTAGKQPIFIERVYRVLGRIPDAWMIFFARLGHRWMEARHLRGIKRRAEALAREMTHRRQDLA